MISGKVNYSEIDTIRFITISIIVWSHSLFPAWHDQSADEVFEGIIKSFVKQLGAISTIIFFIVSGILMRSKLQGYNLKGYFNERIPGVYGPWLFIVFFNIFLIMVYQLSKQDLLANRSLSTIANSIYAIVNGLIVYGPYWFVLTYLVGMVVLIYFKRYSCNIYFGLVLGAITLVYALNFHFEWIDTFHTKAILGYTFFIWLGFQFHTHWEKILAKAKKITWLIMLIMMIVFFSIACYEGYFLSVKGVRDPFASNRMTNIIFSLIFFICLLKIGPIRIINNLRPRKIVYGIYLINSIVIFGLTLLFKKDIDNLYLADIWLLLALQLVFFTITIMLTYLVVYFLINSSLRWIIGSR